MSRTDYRRCVEVLSFIVVCYSSVLLVAPCATAQPSDADVGNSEFFVLFPELRTLPAPQVLATGLRVSYSTLSGGGGMGAAAVLQYDVVAMSATTVVTNQAGYGDIGAGVVPLGQSVARGVPGVGPFWIHPSVLENAESVASGTLSVTRLQKDVAGSTREVVRFQTNTSDGGRVVDEFSAASGLLVFSSIGTTESGSQTTLLSTRQVTPPWPTDRAPNWARPGTTLEYTGTKTTDIQGAGVSEQFVTATVAVREATTAWTTFLQSQTVGGVDGGANETVTGVSQLHGSVWLPRGAVDADLPTQPTLVDTDEITGAQIFLRSDETMVTVQQELSGAIVTWTYDRTFGVLERQRIAQSGVVADEETVLDRSGGSDLSSLNDEPPLPDAAPVASTNQTGNDGGEQNDPEDDSVVVRDNESESGGCSVVPAGRNAWLCLVVLCLWRRSRRHRWTPAPRGWVR